MRLELLLLIFQWLYCNNRRWFVTASDYPVKNESFVVPVLVPALNDVGKCIRKAIEMGFEDIKSEIVEFKDAEKNITRRFTIEPLYEVTDNRPIDAIEAMNTVHPFDAFQFRNPKRMKRATIGPPTNEQTNIFSDFAQVLPTVQFSYSEINEPYDATASLYFQTPPSILDQFNAVRDFMVFYKWEKSVIVYDFSSSRYRLSSNLLLDVLQKEKEGNSIKVVSTTRIRSYNDVNERVDFNELPNLPHNDARIVLLLAGVPGVRQTFCQAYHLNFQKSKFEWILFEELPPGWASSSYDSIDTEGNGKREINCTEEQLLSVTERFIYFTKGGLRRDNKNTTSGMTATQFKTRLNKSVNDSCDERAAYAYDAVWAMVKGQQKVMQSFGSTYYYRFVYLLGFEHTHSISDIVRNTTFEGITGHVSFDKTDYSNNVRIGFSSIRVQHGSKNKSILVGNYDGARRTLELVPNATEKMFNGRIPTGTATYVKRNYHFPKEYIIVIWLLAFLGILVAFALNSVVIVYIFRSKMKRLATLTVDTVISIGCILCYASLVVYGIDTEFVRENQIVDICYVFLCTLSIGFTLTFGALFAKTWWNYKSYSAPSAIRNSTGSEIISEWTLFILIAAFLLVDVVVIICWTLISPFSIEYYKSKTIPLTFAVEVEYIIKCKGRLMSEFTIGMFCYKGVLLIFGVFLAWQTNSKLKGNSSYSKTVSLAIYNTALVSVVGVICVLLLRDTDHRHALYAIIAVCVIISTTTTLAMIYVPKISKILNFDQSDENSNSSDNDSNKTKFNKFTLERLRRRVTNRSPTFPSVSSMQTSNLSLSTVASSLDSRHQAVFSQPDLDRRTNSFSSSTSGAAMVDSRRRGSSFTIASSSNVGSLVSYNPSLVQSSTVLEVPTEEEESVKDFIIENRTSHSLDDVTSPMGELNIISSSVA